jgi:hypothetical protein
MSMTLVGNGTNSGTTITIPAHQVGDLIIISASRANNTAPTIPTGWTQIQRAGANTLSLATGYRIATATNTTSGTWSNAARLTVLVYRPGSGGSLDIGASTTVNGNNQTLQRYPALTLTDTSGGSTVVYTYTRSNTSGSGTAPTNYTAINNIATAPIIGAHHRLAVTANPTQQDVTSLTSGAYRTHGFEITYTPPPNEPPTVTTGATTNLATTSFTQAGNITATGGVDPTVRGFCYLEGSSGTPTTSDTVVSQSGSYGTGSYTLNITGLTASTSYRIRAFATNSEGTGYGTTITVTTLSAASTYTKTHSTNALLKQTITRTHSTDSFKKTRNTRTHTTDSFLRVNQPPTVTLNSPTGAVATYYFDGSDAGPTDPDNAWTNDANAFDGSTATDAITLTSGGVSSNFLLGEGTTAPSSGGVITQVRARIYIGSGDDGTAAAIYTDSLAELLGTANSGSANNHGSYVSLSTPTGGWTWAKLQALEVKIYRPALFTINGSGIARVEIEVTTIPTVTTDTPTLEFTGTDAQSDDIRYQLELSQGTVEQKLAGTGTNVTGVGTVAWSNPNDITVVDDGNIGGQQATAPHFDMGSAVSNYLRASNFGFDIPTEDTVTGVEVKITGRDGNGVAQDDIVRLVDSSGNIVGDNKGTNTAFVNAFTTKSYGSNSDDWGVTLTPSLINNSNFGVVLSLSNINAFSEPRIDNIQIIVHTGSLNTYTSNTDPGFTNTVNGSDTDPFTSGQKIAYEVQSGDALDNGTYYWRARGLDPSGSNTYGAWSDTRSFEVDAGGGSTFTKTHTTDALLKQTITRTHSTNSLLRQRITRTHTTNSLLKARATKTHSTDSFLRKRDTRTHSTNSLLKKTLTQTHTTDSLLREKVTDTRTHTTNSLLRLQTTKAHASDSLLKIRASRTHSTDSLLRQAITKTHTTDAFKRRTAIASHATDALLRKVNTKVHSTDAFLLSVFQQQHSTDALLKKVETVSHSTDAHIALPISIEEVQHATDSLLKTRETLTHSTDAKLAVRQTSDHDTDSLLRLRATREHLTDSFLRVRATREHDTDALTRLRATEAHDTDALIKARQTVTQATDALLRAKLTDTVAHSTDAHLFRVATKSHSTDAQLLRNETADHNTDALLRQTQEASHSTDANLLMVGEETVSHSADSLLRARLTATHSTDTHLFASRTISHATDSYLRAKLKAEHTTDSNLYTVGEEALQHTTDSLLRAVDTVSHATNSLLRLIDTADHSTDAFLKQAEQISHTTDALLLAVGVFAVEHATDSLLRKQSLRSHSTDALIGERQAITHTTDARLVNREVAEHSTDSLLIPRPSYRQSLNVPVVKRSTPSLNKKTEKTIIEVTPTISRLTVRGTSQSISVVAPAPTNIVVRKQRSDI